MAADLSFKRKERKYIILEHTFEEIIEQIQEHIPIFYYEDKPGLLNIQTTYLDTEDFLLFHEYLNKRNFRYKIRLRRYGYDGKYEPEYLIELKIKHNSISTKKRFRLPAEHFAAFVKNEDLRQVVKAANQGLIGAQKTYRIIHKLIQINKFIPVLQTSYNRIAFQKNSKRVRVTVDNGITHKKLTGNPKIETLDAVVLESKIMGKSPKWHKKMVNQLSLLKQQRFSKFATGMNSLYFPERGKYNFYNDDETAMPEIPQRIIDSFEMLKAALKLDDNI
ncbi:MAG: polyphosphate polymerase domain-containing protein [Candidatus Cloacimonetes bacterium]|nr:polyphosphate polymerase domain-containing protein [Candidatus Cloacimonadota bacterium]MCF7814739.1 polyphosphate polymerase domain-containing protein [Candidatus Cloacimonadota bacterium]MCF7868007.1 polyphosphate polymerase domain-containing protein [Candidatus Cloacimonadota bacterium]MCF7883465.1 polyphosphate polymerase domain-containing protein [Candidatus Cloacimonadota bacterium]